MLLVPYVLCGILFSLNPLEDWHLMLRKVLFRLIFGRWLCANMLYNPYPLLLSLSGPSLLFYAQTYNSSQPSFAFNRILTRQSSGCTSDSGCLKQSRVWAHSPCWKLLLNVHLLVGRHGRWHDSPYTPTRRTVTHKECLKCNTCGSFSGDGNLRYCRK